jgi:hypothetical protein
MKWTTFRHSLVAQWDNAQQTQNNCTPVVVVFVNLTLFEEMMTSKNNDIVFEERTELGIYPNLS